MGVPRRAPSTARRRRRRSDNGARRVFPGGRSVETVARFRGRHFPVGAPGGISASGSRERSSETPVLGPGVKPSRAGLHGLPRGSLALHPSINSSVLSQASHRIPTMGEGGRGRRGVGPANAPTFVSVVRRLHLLAFAQSLLALYWSTSHRSFSLCHFGESYTTTWNNAYKYIGPAPLETVASKMSVAGTGECDHQHRWKTLGN